ncbi:MAG TPA: LUD domain-containing protein [Thermoplasmata archaeon]|nr:LUD domain-containing protein [Thermoplasmata archaeon]
MTANAATMTQAAPLTTDPVPDPRYAKLASEEQIQKVVASLERNGIRTIVASDRAAAVQAVLDLIPPGSTILDATSQTLVALGIPQALADSSKFQNLRPQLMQLRKDGQMDEGRRLGAAPDVVVGSVHALTENGQAVIASASGSQLGPYVFGAGRVVWVVGTQKIVPDLESAFQRIEHYTYPLENDRAKKVYGMPSFVAKLLVINREFQPGRITVVLLRENLGF